MALQNRSMSFFPAESIPRAVYYRKQLPMLDMTWHFSRPGLGAGVGMPEGPSAGEGSMNE